jgi:hypothetical protein
MHSVPDTVHFIIHMVPDTVRLILTGISRVGMIVLLQADYPDTFRYLEVQWKGTWRIKEHCRNPEKKKHWSVPSYCYWLVPCYCGLPCFYVAKD